MAIGFKVLDPGQRRTPGTPRIDELLARGIAQHDVDTLQIQQLASLSVEPLEVALVESWRCRQRLQHRDPPGEIAVNVLLGRLDRLEGSSP